MRNSAFQACSTGGVRVVPFGRQHLTERYVSWLNDPEVVRFSEQRHRQHTLESCRAYAASRWASDHYFLAVETIADAVHVGNIGVLVDRPNLLADMSIVIGERAVWGKGVATAAWRSVLTQLLGPLGFRKVIAGTMEVNTAMLNLMARSQMEVEAMVPRYFLWEGQEVGLVIGAAHSPETTPARHA